MVRRDSLRSGLVLALALLLFGGAACSRDADDVTAFCAAVASTPSLDSILRGFAAQEPVPLARNLDAAQESYARVRSTAPAEIRDETDTLVDVVDIVLNAVRENPDDRVIAIGDIRTALAEHGSIDEAALTVSDAVDRLCGIDLNAGLTEMTGENPEPASPSTIPD